MVCAQRVDGSKQSNDWRFVVGCGARVKAPAILIGAWLIRKRNKLSARVDCVGAQRRNERLRARPVAGIYGLAVIVAVKDYRALGAGRIEIAENNGAASWNRQKLRVKTAMIEHRDQR